MSNRSDLNLYIARLQQRLRLGAWLRGAAIFTGTALSLTVVLVFILSRFVAFPAHGVTRCAIGGLPWTRGRSGIWRRAAADSLDMPGSGTQRRSNKS